MTIRGSLKAGLSRSFGNILRNVAKIGSCKRIGLTNGNCLLSRGLSLHLAIVTLVIVIGASFTSDRGLVYPYGLARPYRVLLNGSTYVFKIGTRENMGFQMTTNNFSSRLT